MTEQKRVSVAIVDNSIQPEIYDPVGHWSRYLDDGPGGLSSARDGEFPDPGEFSHIILTGSEASILERDPWVETEAGLVRSAAASGTAGPGQLLGSPAHRLRPGRPGLRRPLPESRDRLDRRPGGPGRATCSARRGRSITSSRSTSTRSVTCRPRFEVLASTDACRVQAFRAGDKPVWGSAEPSRDRHPRRAADSPGFRRPGLRGPGGLPGGLETGRRGIRGSSAGSSGPSWPP
ncbi:MAG: hypothetical protein M0C28_04325 [Candidatus Moduliflexus flocculans]|nr:hypothetical protein [Candidatus Moduliflexus flocculans]